MIKKLLNKINYLFHFKSDNIEIEKYLAKSKDLIDLDQKIRELDRKGAYSKFYI